MGDEKIMFPKKNLMPVRRKKEPHHSA